MILLSPLNKIEIRPIGFVKRTSSDEDVKDRSLVSKIVLKNEFVKGLDGIKDWSHVYVIFWMHKISDKEKMLIEAFGEDYKEYQRNTKRIIPYIY